MKPLEEWFDEYAMSHQNPTNQLIHYFCVPAIFFSIVGLLMSLPPLFLGNLLTGDIVLLENWASVALVFVLLFYFRLSSAMGVRIFFFSALCIVGNYYLSKLGSLWLISLGIFALAWAGQFYGHKIEGRKPSFLKDIQFLLIGPAWVIKKIFG